MASATIKVSIPTFHEISQKIEESTGKKLTDDSSITLTKDTALERPLDWRFIQVRKDMVTEASKVYKAKMDDDGHFELTDSNHFLNFVEDIFKYVLDGTKPATETKSKPVIKDKTPTVESGWGKK